MPTRATKLFQLLDFCVGGAVLMKRLDAAAGARGNARVAAERAISLDAGRNIV